MRTQIAAPFITVLSTVLCTVLIAALASGCHGRFKRVAPTLGAVSVEVTTLTGPSVILPTVGGNDPIAAAVNITQAVRAGNIAAHIEDKVEPQQVNQVFADGFAAELGDGPPFAWDPQSPHRLQFDLMDWGMQIVGPMSPGVFHYTLRVRGYRADGKKFYKTTIRCATDAGGSGWSEMTPFGDNNPNRIKNLPAERVQGIFDATAEDCTRHAIYTMRQHAR